MTPGPARHQLHAFIGDDADQALRTFAATHGVTVSALVESLALALAADGPGLGRRHEKWLVSCARAIDEKRRSRRPE